MTYPSPESLRLSPEEIARNVTGVLAKISRERLNDYHNYPLELAPVKSVANGAFKKALETPELAIIAEIKRASPSQGAIADLDPLEAARAYQAGGAAALSILTEERHFGGRLSYLSEVAEEVDLPCLRKDFIVHPQQITEAAQAGASCVLLIVAVLQEKLAHFLGVARACKLDALVEVHDHAEMDIALATDADIIGVNNRDLRSLSIDLANAPKLIAYARKQGYTGLCVAESGYSQASELKAIRASADAVLIGTSLAGSGDLKTSLQKLHAQLSES